MGVSVVFPMSPLNERMVDEEFAREYRWLNFTDHHRVLLDHDLLSATGEVRLRNLPAEPGPVVYRGWMLSPEAYTALHDTLVARGFTPVTSPAQYAAAHLFPGWYGTFASVTPASALIDLSRTEPQQRAIAEQLGSTAFVIKDHVKSRKHEWATACYAPTIADLPNIIDEFVRLQGEFLVGGIVVREYIDLDKQHPEVRVWWANGEPGLIVPHPDADPTDDLRFDFAFLNNLRPLVAAFGAPFITTDIAFRTTGEPVLIEVGDGQVSGLPTLEVEDAYLALLARL